MEAKELRIGNVVLLDTGHVLPAPHRIVALDIVDIFKGLPTNITIEPIPLTPEVLQKCGFKSNSRCWFLQFKREHDIIDCAVWVSRLEEDPIGMYCFGFDSAMHSVPMNNIYYLHQVQNMYFAITGEELPYTP